MKRTPIRRVSKKRASQLRVYSKLRKEYLTQYPTCAVCQVRPSEHVHHKNKRTNEKLNDTKDWLNVCAFCHRTIHDNMVWARKLGYLV
tara:strand:+ start:59 stop:322 length:264 start_codon:yes stop_codon:yes gene_type:complete